MALPTGDRGSSLRVPFERQRNEYECGLAAAEMIARYYGRPLAAPVRLALAGAARDSGGISGGQLRSALRSAGFFAVLYPGSLGDSSVGLFHELDSERPAIVMFRFAHTSIGHYVVVYGYDMNRNAIYILDPDRGEVAMRADRFVSRWKESGYFTLLAIPEREASGETGQAPLNH